ncbi:MAG: metallopeptidase TldD-related protein [Elusimicrobiota bacterium]|jgi:predicted Zn-dependent protease
MRTLSLRSSAGLLLLALLAPSSFAADAANDGVGSARVRDAAAHAGPSAKGDDPVLRAMGDEVKRSVERLEMQKLGKPYFVSATVVEDDRLEIEGVFGALKDPNRSRSRRVRTVLRIGSREFDNAHYVGKDYWHYQPFTDVGPIDDDYDAVRGALWLTADQAYKQALEKLSQKEAYRHTRNITEKISDLSKDPVSSARLPSSGAVLDQPLWEERVRRLSAVFRKYPAVQRSSVGLYFSRRTTRLADSEGRRLAQPDDDFELLVSASGQAKDGMTVKDRRRVIRRRIEDFPDLPALEAEAARLAQDVTDLASATVAEPYVGPVLLEGPAAGEFFNQLLAHNVSFPRELWIEDEGVKGEFGSGELAPRLGLRVISPLFDVTDDPSAESAAGQPLLGTYAYDDEGIAARPVRIAEKGLLKDLPMGREPIKEREGSNGHGRGAFWEFPTAHISNLFVVPRSSIPLADLRKELLKRAADFGLPYGIVIRRLGEEDDQDKDELLAAPVLAYKVDVKTGKEELLRSAQFSGVSLRALRDIALASDRTLVYNYYQLGPYKVSRGQTQASIVSPDVLLAEMEFKKTDRKPEKPPYLKHPYFDK